MLKLSGVVLAAFFLFAPATHSQNNPPSPTSSPQAVTLARQALSALTGPVQMNDVTLTGTGTRTAGSDIESGNISLKALGNGLSRLDLTVAGFTRSEIRNLDSNNTLKAFGSDSTGTSIRWPTTIA